MSAKSARDRWQYRLACGRVSSDPLVVFSSNRWTALEVARARGLVTDRRTWER